MSSDIQRRLVNGPTGDPAVHGFLPRSGDAFLFDLGSLDALSNRDLLKVRHAFVSHCHVDHFIGFDRLLRVNIPHFRHVEIVGPEGMTRHVRGKLEGYLWNLLEPGQVRFGVTEVMGDGEIRRAVLSNDHEFEPTEALTSPPGASPVAEVAGLGDGTLAQAVVLDHMTPSVAYALRSPRRYHVVPERLAAEGLDPGPWIREIQVALSEGNPEKVVEAGGRTRPASEWAADIMRIREGASLGYVTDLAFSRENLARCKRLFLGVGVLICETNYRDLHRERAREKAHLTTRQGALLAAHCKAGHLEPFHISNLYVDAPDAAVQEAKEFFEKFSRLENVDDLIEEELSRNTTA